MARMRDWQAGLGRIGDILLNSADNQRKVQQQQQTEQGVTLRELIPGVLKGEYDPSQLPPDVQSQLRGYSGPPLEARVQSAMAKPNFADAKSLSDLTTPEQLLAAIGVPGSPNNGTGPIDATKSGPIAAAIAALKAKQEALAGQQTVTPQDVENDNGSMSKVGMVNNVNGWKSGPVDSLQVKPDATTQGTIQGTIEQGKILGGAQSPEVQAATTAGKVAETNALAGPQAAAAGQKETATSNAAFPNQAKLAQVKANIAEVSRTEHDQWLADHPRATAQDRARQAAAVSALQFSDLVHKQLDNLDKHGLLGLVRSQYTDLAAGKVKSEAAFGSPELAADASDFVSSMKLLASAAAVAHGGARGGGSPQMAKLFESIVNGLGDRANTEGQLRAVDNIMKVYSKDPTQTLTLPTTTSTTIGRFQVN